MTKADLIQYVLDRWGNITSPKRVPLLDREVAGKLIDEVFPTPVKVEWSGTSSVSPTTDIVVYASLATGKVKFTIRFWKSGNKVYANGEIENYSGAMLSDIQLITFATSLFEPLTTSPIIVNCEANNTSSPISTSTFKIKVNDGGVFLFGTIPPSANVFSFHFDYIVAN